VCRLQSVVLNTSVIKKTGITLSESASIDDPVSVCLYDITNLNQQSDSSSSTSQSHSEKAVNTISTKQIAPVVRGKSEAEWSEYADTRDGAEYLCHPPE
jgi:hypothetical protein